MKPEELTNANNLPTLQPEEHEKTSLELSLAIKELAFQKKEIEKKAVELMIANRELTLQNEENKRRGEELSVANGELKAVENQLKVVNKELEAFSYSVSHDLRAPLRAIHGYSNMLKEDYGSVIDFEANRIIDVIINNSQMMSELINNLLSFSKMARLEAVSNSVKMYSLAETAVNELLQLEKQKSISLKILPLPDCKGDANMLKQVWHNLIDNAIKYSSKKPNPQIEIGFIEDADKHIFYVKDNGVGFEMKYASKLFGVFQRLHRQDEFEGTGLGLALVKRIVTKHGGDIWTQSNLNEGATFYFSIPKQLT